MNKINVLIIEDLKEESDRLTEVLSENGYNVMAVASDFKSALKYFYELPIDIAIVDVFLDGVPDGLTFAETITTVGNDLKPFVFLTSSKDRTVFERAKLTKPYSFLLKPFNELEVLYAIEMAIEKFHEQNMALTGETQNAVMGEDFLFIKKKRSLKKVMIADVLYAEVEGRYCNIMTADEKFVVQISLVRLAEKFEPHGFVRTHRNYLVNANMIEEIIPGEDSVILKGNHCMPLSEKYKGLLKKINFLS